MNDIAIEKLQDLMINHNCWPEEIYQRDGQWFMAELRITEFGDQEISESAARFYVESQAISKMGKQWLSIIQNPKSAPCLICEKLLEPVSDTSQEQPYGGGEISVNFCYGSRKYDHIVFREQVLEPGYNQHMMKRMKGEPSDWKPTKSKDGIMGCKPVDSMINHEDRDMRLASCYRVKSIICDDCFKEKSHLFRGYEKIEDNGKLELIVE